MVVADLVDLVDEIQLVYGKNMIRPNKIEDLEKYAYCPVLKVKPGVYARQAVIRVYIDNHISLSEMRKIKNRINKRR